MCIPTHESEDEWYEIKFGEPVPYEKARLLTFHKILSNKILMNRQEW